MLLILQEKVNVIEQVKVQMHVVRGGSGNVCQPTGTSRHDMWRHLIDIIRSWCYLYP